VEQTHIQMRTFFDPDLDDRTRLGIIENFARSLRVFPRWAVAWAFDEWSRIGKHRPAPAHIYGLASDRLRQFTDEIARRQRLLDDPRNERALLAVPVRQRCSPEEALRITYAAGFTPKRLNAVQRRPMASTPEELEAAMASPPEHWTKRPNTDPKEIEALRAARAANPIMADMMRRAAVAESAGILSAMDEAPPPMDGEDGMDVPPDWMDAERG